MCGESLELAVECPCEEMLFVQDKASSKGARARVSQVEVTSYVKVQSEWKKANCHLWLKKQQDGERQL